MEGSGGARTVAGPTLRSEIRGPCCCGFQTDHETTWPRGVPAYVRGCLGRHRVRNFSARPLGYSMVGGSDLSQALYARHDAGLVSLLVFVKRVAEVRGGEDVRAMKRQAKPGDQRGEVGHWLETFWL